MLSNFDRRRAVSEWRDDWSFQVWEALSGAAQQAIADLRIDLPSADLWNIYADQSAFANPRVDRSMRGALQPFLDRLTTRAGPSLHAIDPGLAGLCVALSQTDFAKLLPDELADGSYPASMESPYGPAGTAAVKLGIGSVAAVGARMMFGPPAAIAIGLRTLADVASAKFRHWLLDAGGKRVTEAWFGADRARETVAWKILAVIDDASVKAREVLQ